MQKLLAWKIPVIFLFVAVFSIFLVSCKDGWGEKRSTGNEPLPTAPDLDKPREQVKDASDKTKVIAEKVDKSASTIEKNANNIEKHTPEESKPKVQPEIDSIKTETGELKKDSNELKVISQRLKDTEVNLTKEKENVTKWTKYAKDADKQIVGLQKELDQLKQENEAMFKRSMSYLIVLCVAGIGICAVLAFWTQSKVAIMVAAGFVVTMFIALGVSLYMKAFAIIAVSILGAAFLGITGYLAWHFFIRNKAERELVQTNEIAKQYLAPDLRQKLFGYGAEPGKVDVIQSKTTKNRVKKIRSYDVDNGKLKLAPKLPEFWRPPDISSAPRTIIDPYLGIVSKVRTETII